MARFQNQPTYDFLTGASPPPPAFKQTFRESQAIQPDEANESIRAQVHKLNYEIETLKQERELVDIRHEKELRDAQAKADAEFRKTQAAESVGKSSAARYDALLRELQEHQDRSANEKLDAERKLRTLQEQNRSLQEDAEEAQSELSSLERQSQHQLKELEGKCSTLQSAFDDLRIDLDSKVGELRIVQQKLAQREAQVGELESEVIRLKAQNGDTDTLAVIKRELTEQVTHIRKLEATNREQQAELKQFRKQHKAVEVVEEEKRVLESKISRMKDLERQLGEAEMRIEDLQNERQSWTAYLETQEAPDGELRFEAPEDMARAFVELRLEKLALVDKLGAVQPEIGIKEQNIARLEDEKAKLSSELTQLRATGTTSNSGSDSKAKARLERQRTLAVKEVEYLRAQLKAFDAEELEVQPDKFDEQKSKRIQELEEMVDQYRNELQTVHGEVSAAETNAQQPSSELAVGGKRRREDDDDERVGELRRRNRQLQDDIEKYESKIKLLETEVKAHQSQLKSLKSSSRTRVLELRTNPTAQVEAVKMSTLRTLREENAALLQQLQGKLPTDEKGVVPKSSLENARLQITELEKTVAEREKRISRLKQIWSAKSLEFREAVASVLGWKMDFMPNGRVRVTSMFYPGEEDDENSIVFDGENGTMKVSGGPKSAFALEIKDLIEFWVEGRKDIPCFLAAMTLEFYDRTTRAAKA